MTLSHSETHKALGEMISEGQQPEAAEHILAEAVSAVHHLCDQYDLNFQAVLDEGALHHQRQREGTQGTPGRARLHNEFTAIIEHDGPWFIAYCAEVPGANGQGRSREECLSNLREAILLILEQTREDSLRAMPPEAEQDLVIVG
jgi:predicted RNase H-like HicB family nuclease